MDTEIKIGKLRRRDYAQAVRFAIEGMHFDLYLDGRWLLALYGRYFLYDELNHATQVIAAYQGDRLVGLLLAEVRGEKRACWSLGKAVYAGLVDFVQRHLFRNGISAYDEANQEMLARYAASHTPDGQIVFLAADPHARVRGIGTLLLHELERRERGKTLYLYTDDNCTWQFYEHRGFTRMGEKQIMMALGTKSVPLQCMLYAKEIK